MFGFLAHPMYYFRSDLFIANTRENPLLLLLQTIAMTICVLWDVVLLSTVSVLPPNDLSGLQIGYVVFLQKLQYS